MTRALRRRAPRPLGKRPSRRSKAGQRRGRGRSRSSTAPSLATPTRAGGRVRPTEVGPATFTIRRGRRRDVATIVGLIRGLAHYERLGHEVKISAARVDQDGFGRRPYFETLICTRRRTPIGFALYFFTYSTFLARPSLYLEDLFVRPEARGQGVGKALLAELARIARRRGCGRMEWTVLDWNTPAIAFYRRLGAHLHKEWILTRVTGAALGRLARSRPPGPRAGRQLSTL